MLPAICYTDASFEGGNSTPDQIAKAAAGAGVRSVMVHDHNSMSAVLRFAKSCKKNELNMLVGVQLSVHLERHALSATLHQYWDFFKEQIEESIAWPDAMAIVKAWMAHTIGSHDKFHQEVRDFYDSSSVPCSFFAENELGYKNLLKLCSMRSIKKKVAITGDSSLMLDDVAEDCESSDAEHPSDEDDDGVGGSVTPLDRKKDYPLLLQDILKYQGSVKVAVAGHLLERPLKSPYPYDLSELMSTGNGSCVFVCIDVGRDPSQQQWLLESAPQIKLVPTHLVRFLSPDEYDDYVVKIAAHRLEEITHPEFKFPDRRLHLRTQAVIDEQMLKWSGRQDVAIDFWDSVLPVNIRLGNIELPSFAMPYADVVTFAFQKENVDTYAGHIFNSDEEALSAFDEWLKQSFAAETAVSFLEYRQKKLNDFCLYKLSYEGVIARLAQYGEQAASMKEEYLARHQMEFDVISRMGFSGYFLIEYDFVQYARRSGVPVGDGRGSAAGSLIVYALEITDVDPIVFDLQFERFLNPERVSMPDIDTDFGSTRSGNRNSVLKYISHKYQQQGSEFPSSSQIANVNAYKLRSAIPKVRAALGLSMTYDAYLRRIVKNYCQVHGLKASEDVSWDDFLSYEPIMLKMQQEPVLVKVFRHARALTGKRSSYGVHAGGVVIAPTVITDYSAIECDASGKIFCQYDKDDVELAGLVKFDVLGLRTLTLIYDAVYQIERDYGISLDPRHFSLDDPKVMAMINELKLADIFQLESAGMRQLVMKLQPKDVSEIAVLSALFRPGALESKMPEEFVDVKFGRKPAHYDHPALESVTKDTYGCIVYQEQVMSIVRALAGYSLGEADVLRRVMGKKKVEEMKKQKSLYNYRAQQHWREHYIETGKQHGSSIPWDVCLLDLKEELEQLELSDCLSETGYLCDVVEVVPALAKLLRLNSAQEQLMRDRFNNISYVVREFKGHYHAAVVSAIQERLRESPAGRVEEACVRIYYALSQMVRFNQIFNKVEKFAGYGFNKSHALAYSLMTYRSAWLKYYYPHQFFSAALNMRNLHTLEPTVLEMKYQFRIPLLRPDINASSADFHVDMSAGGVRYGLSKLKGVANSAASIVKHRETEGPYKGIYELLVRAKHASLDKTSMMSLIKAGALDSLLPTSICQQLLIHPRALADWLFSRSRELKNMVSKEESSGAHWVDVVMHSQNEFDFFNAVAVFGKSEFFEASVSKLNGYFLDRFREIFPGHDDVAMQLSAMLENWRVSGVVEAELDSIELVIAQLCTEDSRLSHEWARLKERELKVIRINQLIAMWQEKTPLLNAMAAKAANAFSLEPQRHGGKKSKRSAHGFSLDDETLLSMCHLLSKDAAPQSVSYQVAMMVVEHGVDSLSIAVRKILENIMFWVLLDKFGQDLLPFGWAAADAGAAWRSFWLFVLRDASKRSPVTYLEDERDVAGCYLTQTPAQLIRLAQLAEEEPAGSYLDGCPIQLNQVDSGSHDRKVSTWGTVRKVELRTIKREDSVMFNEKFMTFYLVSDIHELKCTIMGTRAVSAVQQHLVDGALVLLSGKVSAEEQYGISLRVEAYKCFYPSSDGRVWQVPRSYGRKKR